MATPKISKTHKRVIEAKKLADDDRELRKALDGTIDVQKNNFWDEAYNSYIHMRSGYSTVLLDLRDKVHRFINDPQYVKTTDVSSRLVLLLNQLGIDNTRFFNSIDEIYKVHADKRGAAVGYDDHMLLLKVNQDYAQTNDIYVQAVTPIVDEINQIIGVTQRAVEAANKLQEEMALADPTVVSDAVIVDKTSESQVNE